MRKNRDFELFVDHSEWYEKDWDTGLFKPTAEAPKKIIEAIERVNERILWEHKQDTQY